MHGLGATPSGVRSERDGFLRFCIPSLISHWTRERENRNVATSLPEAA